MEPTKTDIGIGISYLRVSSKKQLNTAADVDPEGNSINTQRGSTQDKARAMRVVLQKEFVEPGTSAQGIAKRKVFKEMLAYLKAHPDVKYVFIYMRSRAFRDYVDAGVTERQLNEMGVQLISAREDFGEGYMARAMKAVTDIMNDVQVKMQGQDVSVKMHNKVKNGGTVTLAKIGYLNRQIIIEDDRKVNSIVIDPKRGPLIRQAFELYGTGQHTLDSVLEIVIDAGLTAVGRRGPIVRQTLHKALRDKYYIGIITYKGLEYPGRHEPLISVELFERVQRIMNAHSGSGTRQREHKHYLKGLVWCGRCGHRFTLMPGRGRGGEYFYFLCRGRQQKRCDHPYVPVDVMEELVEQHYQSLPVLPAELRQRVHAAVHKAVAVRTEPSTDLRAQFTNRLAKLDSKENYFLDLAADEGWPKDKLRARLDAIRDERANISRQLDQAANELEIGRQVFLTALDLLDTPAALYARGNETVRAVLNNAFFGRLFVDGQRVTDHILNGPFKIICEAYTIYRRQGAHRPAAGLEGSPRQSDLPAWLHEPQTASSPGLLAETGATSVLTWTDSLADVLGDVGSSKAVLVGVTGFEPATSSSRTKRATKLRHTPMVERGEVYRTRAPAPNRAPLEPSWTGSPLVVRGTRVSRLASGGQAKRTGA
ncbi:hypothetical protein Acsp05_45610 [Actinokineospora sp. NBRC 105648]|nr:hypothetical protein Acsp05_45610 [Actinokineospora sp. NBRC 105648]